MEKLKNPPLGPIFLGRQPFIGRNAGKRILSAYVAGPSIAASLVPAALSLPALPVGRTRGGQPGA